MTARRGRHRTLTCIVEEVMVYRFVLIRKTISVHNDGSLPGQQRQWPASTPICAGQNLGMQTGRREDKSRSQHGAVFMEEMDGRRLWRLRRAGGDVNDTFINAGGIQ